LTEFSQAELLTAEALAAELVRRATLNEGLLERLATAVDNRNLDVFLFLWKYSPATFDQLAAVFPRSTLSRSLRKLEACDLVRRRGYEYRVPKMD